MKKKSKNIYSKLLNKIAPLIIILCILIKWQILSITGVVPKFMLPSPFDVIKAFVNDFPLLVHHMKVTLVEASLGLGMGVILGFLVAIIIAPLLVLWLGYGILPKIVLIVLTSFFPITIGLLDGFKSADKDALKLMKTMGATPFQNFVHIKLPSSIGYFFAGLRISVSYSIIGAVVAEWLGGFDGLGVYMTRVRKSYSFDKMFAVIFLISIISLFLMFVVKKIQKLSMPWEEAI